MAEHLSHKTGDRSVETVKPDPNCENGDEVSKPLNLNRFIELTKQLLSVSRDELRHKEVELRDKEHD